MVKISDYIGREQAFVKHRLLGTYLPDWGYKIGSKWDTLIYVDGFAGPWQVKTNDFSDSSFGIAVSALKKMRAGLLGARNRDIKVRCILIEKDEGAFARLDQFAKNNHQPPGFNVQAIKGEFIDKLPELQELIGKDRGNPFRFVFLDPKGWDGMPMLQLAPFLRKRSCEVLITLMTKHMNRFYALEDRKESYDGFFGRPEVLEKLRRIAPDDRQDVALTEYCESLKTLCEFEYVSSAVILSPKAEEVIYFLVFGTNDVKGVKVFKKAEAEAAQSQNTIRCQTVHRRGRNGAPSLEQLPLKTRLVCELHSKYLDQAKRRVIQLLISSSSDKGVPYKTLFFEAMEFPLVTPQDLEQLIKGEPALKLQFAGPSKRRTPDPNLDDRVFVVNRADLEARLKPENKPIQASMFGMLGCS